MEVREVKKQIKARVLQPFYIFIGEELEVQNIYLHKMAEISGKDIEWIDDASIAFQSNRASLFAKPMFYVCRDDKEFLKAEKVWDTIDESLGKNILVFLWTSPNKTTKFYKKFSDRIVEFKHMEADILAKYARKVVDVSDYWMNELLYASESDYGTLLNECDKIYHYAQKSDCTPNESVSRLFSAGIIHMPPQDAIFDWVDAILKAKPKLAYSLLNECKAIGEPSLRLLLVLYTNARKLLQVQSCHTKDVASTTGLSDWDIKCMQDKVGYWGEGDLVFMLKLIQNVESGIKTGRVDDKYAIDYVMARIFE